MSIHNFLHEMQETRFPDASTTVVKLESTLGGLALRAYGNTVPTDGGAGYITGCLFLHADAAGGTALHCNQGSGTSCNFDAVTIG